MPVSHNTQRTFSDLRDLTFTKASRWGLGTIPRKSPWPKLRGSALPPLVSRRPSAKSFPLVGSGLRIEQRHPCIRCLASCVTPRHHVTCTNEFLMSSGRGMLFSVPHTELFDEGTARHKDMKGPIVGIIVTPEYRHSLCPLCPAASLSS